MISITSRMPQSWLLTMGGVKQRFNPSPSCPLPWLVVLQPLTTLSIKRSLKLWQLFSIFGCKSFFGFWLPCRLCWSPFSTTLGFLICDSHQYWIKKVTLERACLPTFMDLSSTSQLPSCLLQNHSPQPANIEPSVTPPLPHPSPQKAATQPVLYQRYVPFPNNT